MKLNQFVTNNTSTSWKVPQATQKKKMNNNCLRITHVILGKKSRARTDYIKPADAEYW